MRVVRSATEPEVVATFLRAELASERWRPQLLELLQSDGADERIVSEPDVRDPDANAYRERLLDRHRGWLRREGLFAGLPRTLEWELLALAPDEVLSILYIDWDWWLRLSDGTRDARVAAERIHAGLVPGQDVEGDRAIAARLRSTDPPPDLIAVAPPDLSKLVLLEGHVRLTAYALFPELLPDELDVYVGTSSEIHRWSEY